MFAILGFIGSFFIDRLKPFKRELGCLVLSLGLATSFVTPVKAVTAVQCPWSLEQFGGHETYSKLMEHRPQTNKPGRCWPGGHAATGFTLFALFFVLRDRRPRLARQAFIFAFALGSVFSISRMMQGAHFFSHNVWTAIFCWLICLGSYYWVLYRPAVKAEAVARHNRSAPEHKSNVGASLLATAVCQSTCMSTDSPLREQARSHRVR